jgi:hypothetical protein
MEKYPIEELKLIYRILHRQLVQHTELLDAQLFEDLQTHLQKRAMFEGIDIGDHGAWDAWLGNEVVDCSARMVNRMVIE